MTGARKTPVLWLGLIIATFAAAGGFSFPLQGNMNNPSRAKTVAVHITQGTSPTHWDIDAYGVSVEVSLSAPHTVMTMTENSFTASAQIVSINGDSPFDVHAVYIYTLSVFVPRPGGGGWSGSAGITGSSENMTVGDTTRIRHQVIISAGSCYLVPGQSRILICYVGVEMGVVTGDGTLHHHQETFQYPFEVIAGADAIDQGWLVGAANLSSLSLLLMILIVGTAYVFSVRKRNAR